MKKFAILFICVALMATLVACDSGGSNNVKPEPEDFVRQAIDPDEFIDSGNTELTNDYRLVWADEFNYTGSPDSAKWNYEVGGGGWGNGEAQFYTSRDDNSYVDNGYLTITAKKESYNGSNYTSARLTTKNKGDWKYGYVEIRAQIPTGGGTWPALWMMPTDSVYGGWPNSGEIDIMETTGNRPSYIQGTVHTKISGHGGSGGAINVNNSTTDWNLYTLEWTEQAIKFGVNGRTYYTYSHLSNYDEQRWPFDQRFFIILNVAMGGSMGGAIDSNFQSGEMKVDYVRVYQKIDRADTEKPGKPEITKTVASYNSINIEWDKVLDNQGIKQYDIVVNNKQIGATISNRYQIKNLTPDTNYQVRVIAVDYNDNWTISDVFNISTLKASTLPGLLYGYGYQEATQSVYVTSGSDTDGGNVLQIPANTTVSYQAKCTTSGGYTLSLRAATTLSSTINVKVFQGGSLIYDSSIDVSKSYGKYNTYDFSEELNLNTGDITIQLTCTATGSTSSNAMLLNYLSIQK